jgi:hypothetical protein
MLSSNAAISSTTAAVPTTANISKATEPVTTTDKDTAATVTDAGKCCCSSYSNHTVTSALCILQAAHSHFVYSKNAIHAHIHAHIYMR